MKLTRPAGMTRRSSYPQDAHGLAREGRSVSVLSRLGVYSAGPGSLAAPLPDGLSRKAEARRFCTGMTLPEAADGQWPEGSWSSLLSRGGSPFPAV